MRTDHFGLGEWVPKRFPPELEEAYAKRFHERALVFGRVATIIGLLYFVFFMYWDMLLDPDAMSKTFTYRAGAVVHFALAFSLSFLPVVRRSIRLWPYFLFYAYLGVAVPFPLISGLLPNAFSLGAGGYIVGMVFLALVVSGVKQAAMVMIPYMTVVLVGMYFAGANWLELTNTFIWIASAVCFSAVIAHVLDVINRRAYQLECELEAERERSEALLLNILPEEIAERLKAHEEPLADRIDCVSVLFVDLVGFTNMSRTMAPDEVVTLLNDLFSRFDEMSERHGAEKVKTIGDAYMVATGLLGDRKDHAERMADLALDMQASFQHFCKVQGRDLEIRIGIHAGPVVAGVIGTRKFSYDMWGDTVNLASRMESEGVPGRIQMTDSFRDMLPDRFRTTLRGEIPVKGHDTRTTYFLEGG